MSAGYMEGVRKVFGRYLEGFWREFGMCQEGDWKVSGQCLEVIWKVSGKYQNHSVSSNNFGRFASPFKEQKLH